MSERRAPAAADPLATLSDHLGRLLAHADRLLAEWQEHADAMRARFEAEAREAGNVLRKTLEAALADAGSPGRVAKHLDRAQKAAADLERAPSLLGGGDEEALARLARDLTSLRQEISRIPRPEPNNQRIPVLLSLSANALLVALIAIVLVRKPPAAAPVRPAGMDTPTPVAVPDAGTPAPTVPPPAATPCSAVALSGPEAEHHLNECLERACATPEAPIPGCQVLHEGDKHKKHVVLSCKVGEGPSARSVRIEWPYDCPPAPPPPPK